MTAPVPQRPPKPKPVPPPGMVLDVAASLSGAGGANLGGSWARSAAFLVRQALEQAVEGLYTGPLSGVRSCPPSTQMICLRRYLADRALAAEVHATWAQLSTACHAHPYELDPALAELQRWIAVVRRLIDATTGAAP